jgi:hypothetical protein
MNINDPKKFSEEKVAPSLAETFVPPVLAKTLGSEH